MNACNKPKCEKPKCKGDGFVFRKVVIPAQLGDDETGQDKPENGAMTNSFVTYEANGAQYIYDSNGIYTKFAGGDHPVLSVNGKTGEVVLSTSDLENDSGYVTGEFVDDAVDGAITLEATLREAADDQLSDRIDDVAEDVALETSSRQDADSDLSDRIVEETEARREADNGLQSQIDAITASSDVTDIVGTYAELQAYDTSTLGDRDIIKVLQDESRDDETTYYRWSTTTQTFTLIGEEGPYYTKAAADTKFQDKLTAGANITIGVNNEISATDTTYSDFTGTDGVDPGTSGLVPAPAVGDEDKYLKGDGTWDTVAAGPTVVQTTGTSTTDVMSQDATTKMIYNSANTGINISREGFAKMDAPEDSVIIGSTYNNTSFPFGRDNVLITSGSVSARGRYLTGIGASVNFGSSSDSYQTALGYGATPNGYSHSVALGDSSRNNGSYQVSVGSGSGTQFTRRISFVTDPTLAQDAATKNYTDNLTISYAAINDSTAPTTATEAKYIGQLYYDTTNSDLYYCSAITPQGTDPETYIYTWTVVGGGPTVVQTTGTSTTDVMSQAATSQMIYPSGYEVSKNRIAIGGNASASVSGAIAIGPRANAGGASVSSISIGNDAYSLGRRSVAIGGSAYTLGDDSVVIGYNARISDGRANTVSVGGGSATYAPATRYLANVTDPQLAQDAATKNYVDSFYPVGSVYSSTSSTAPTFAGGTWTNIGSQTIGSSTVYYYERTA